MNLSPASGKLRDPLECKWTAQIGKEGESHQDATV